MFLNILTLLRSLLAHASVEVEQSSWCVRISVARQGATCLKDYADKNYMKMPKKEVIELT